MVDARIGPGIKSMSKFKKRKEEQLQQQNGTDCDGPATQNIRSNHSISERLGKIFKKTKKKRVFKSPTKTAPKLSDDNSDPTSPMSSQSDSLDENRNSDTELNNRLTSAITVVTKRLNINSVGKEAPTFHGPCKNRRMHLNSLTSFIADDQWLPVQSCHGLSMEHKSVQVIEKQAEAINSADIYSLLACTEQMEIDTTTSVDVSVKLPTPTFNKSLPPKKQFRMLDPMVDIIVQQAPIDYSIPSTSQVEPQDLTTTRTSSSSSDNEDNARSTSILHKIKADNGRIVKKSTARLMPKKKLTDLDMVKNLVKLCTDKNLTIAVNGVTSTTAAAATKTTPLASPSTTNQSNFIVNTTGVTAATVSVVANKYSDNSSDSGYEETLHESNLLNHGTGIVQRNPVILPNGIKLHVNPETVLYRMNMINVVPNAPVSVTFFLAKLKTHYLKNLSSHRKFDFFH